METPEKFQLINKQKFTSTQSGLKQIYKIYYYKNR